MKVKQSIFYFDDEVQALDLFRELFKTEYEVRTAHALPEARRLLSEHPADIIISDQEMPEISGTEFLAEATRDYPLSCRIMVTGSMLAGEAIPEILAGIVHFFVPKPWTEQEMRQTLERAGLQADLNRLNQE